MGLDAGAIVFANVWGPSRPMRVWPIASVLLPPSKHFKNPFWGTNSRVCITFSRVSARVTKLLIWRVNLMFRRSHVAPNQKLGR